MTHYHQALQWFESSPYKIIPTLKGKQVLLELYENDRCIKTDTIPFDTQTALTIQDKIIKLYDYSTNQNRQ